MEELPVQCEIATPSLATALAYWRAMLDDAPPLLELPTDRPRSTSDRGRTASLPFCLDAALCQALQAVAHRHDTTLFVVLHAALVLVLSRWCYQEDIVIGGWVGGRHGLGPLVLRTHLKGNSTVSEFLASIRRSDIAAADHQVLPFEQLVAQLQPEDAPGQLPPLQVLLMLEDSSAKSVRSDNTKVERLSAEAGTVPSELMLRLAEAGQGALEGSLVYDDALFDTATVGRMATHLRRLLGALVRADPDSRVTDLQMLPPAELHLVLSQWNATAAAYPEIATVSDLFEVQVARTPKAAAIAFGDMRLDYAELNARANRLARRLVGLGAGPETIVGVAVERSPAMIVAIIAALKAGAAYLPLDPSYPRERLDFMLRDAGCVAIVAQQSLAGDLPDVAQVVLMDDPAEARRLAEFPATNLGAEDRIRALDPDCLAYVLYTSGSTGQPKGVCMPHRPLVNLLCWQQRTIPAEVGERTLQFTSINFDVSFQEIGATLTAGGTLVLIDDATRRDPASLLEYLRRTGTNRLFLPFAALQSLAEAAAGKPDLPELRVVVTAGEQLRLTATIRALFAGMPGCRLHNHYGPTESHVVTAYSLDDAPAEWQGDAPIGGPIDNTCIYVLDAHRALVPLGATGELFIGGVALARGYLGRPDLTAERFIANPFGAPGQRLYRTGDLVRWRPDGVLEYLGRSDQQVKIRGFRVEPGEIEAALLAHPSIAAAAVVAHRTANGDRLIGYLVAGVEKLSRVALRTHLATSLPDYMIPAIFVWLDRMPLTPSGKVNRRALPAPDMSREDDGKYLAPRTPQEATLARIWAEVLGLGRVGIDDNFFDIGGDSIIAFRITALSRKAGLALTPRDLATHPTIRALSERAAAPTVPAVDRGVITGECPLSPMQRYYFTWAKPNPNKFNVGFIARTPVLLDPIRLDLALRAIVRHHDALRLRFWRDDSGIWRQRFVEDDTASCVPMYCMQVPDGSDETRLAFVNREVARLHDTLNIENGPVMVVGLFNGGTAGEHHFFLAMHELVTDAISLHITLEDLRHVYQDLVHGRPPNLPDKTTSYRRWIGKVIDYVHGPAARQFDYWLDRGRAAHPFPEDDDAPGALQRDIELYGFQVLNANEVKHLRSRNGGGFQSRLIHAIVAALTLTANRLSGQRDLIFHKVAHGRETCIPDTDVSRTVGWFITHTPITLRLPDGPLDHPAGLAATLDAISRQYREIPDNGLAHSALRYFSDDPRALELAEHDEVRTLFQYVGDVWEDNYDGKFFLPPDASLVDVPDSVAADNLADYRLHVYSYLMDGCFRVKFFYTRRNYQPETISHMADLFSDALRGMLLA